MIDGSDIRTCEDALRRLAEFLDGELRTADSAALQDHLDHCRSCCSRARFEEHLRQRLAALGRADVSPALAVRIHDLVRSLTPVSAD